MTPILGYWNGRNLGEPIRYLLHYKGLDFEDKRYLNFDVWQTDKFALGLDFPNLPYYIDGDVKLTQSTAILRHLARKHKLDGSNEEEKRRVDLIEQQIIDFRDTFRRTCRSPEFEKSKAELLKNVPAQMKLFSNFLGDRKFLAGDSVTYVDFLAYETFDYYDLFIPSLLNNYPNLKDYHKRVENLPELQCYFKSPTRKRWPILGSFAKFGGNGEEPKRE